jgi:hypothetical protein
MTWTANYISLGSVEEQTLAKENIKYSRIFYLLKWKKSKLPTYLANMWQNYQEIIV